MALVVAVAMLLMSSGPVPELTGEGGYVCVSQQMADGSAVSTFEYDEWGRLVSAHREYGMDDVVTVAWTGEDTCQERQEVRDDGYERITTYDETFSVVDGRVDSVGLDMFETLTLGDEGASDTVESSDVGESLAEYRPDGSIASVTTEYDSDENPIITRYYDDHGYYIGSSGTDGGAFQLSYDEQGYPVSVMAATLDGGMKVYSLETDDAGNITTVISEEGGVLATFEYRYISDLSAVGRYQALAYEPHLFVAQHDE